MCGIIGVFKINSNASWKLTPDVTDKMLQTIHHRGPDSQGSWHSSDESCWFGHTRLSIIDISGGIQPMPNETGDVWACFNGEIYNHMKLHRELERAGHKFQSRCDTEVLVHGYEEWGGMELVKKLQGMFAFAIYDSKRQSMFVARDRVGIKPLYWWSDGNVFIFASEIKAMLCYPGLSKRNVDRDALAQFLAFRYVPSPLTLFKNVSKLPGGHYIELQLDKSKNIQPNRYWDVSFQRHQPMPSYEEATNELDHRLSNIVKDHLMSDVPLGAQLSGGVDSSLIVAYMERLRQESGNKEKVRTFSIGFDRPEYSELIYARQVAQLYNTQHFEQVVGFNDFLREFARICWIYDEPIAESSAIPTYLICKYAKREGVTVMLTGEGGDELFAGYPKCAFDQFSRYLDWIPSGIRQKLLRSSAAVLPFSGRRLRVALETLSESSQEERFVSWFSAFDTKGLSRLLRSEFKNELVNGNAPKRMGEEIMRCDSNNSLDRMLYADLHTWLVDDLLIKGDRMSMGSSVEARVPYLDHTLVEWAAGLPPSYKVKGTKTKRILKNLAEKYIPMECIYRRKVGFTVPLSPWFIGPLNEFIRDNLLSDQAFSRGYFNPNEITQIVDEHLSGKVDHNRTIWSLLALEMWHRLFVDDDGSESASERLNEQIMISCKMDLP
ncbi:MAG: asparagine synthase (glutamine-hydrolyzing) [bacterium]